MKNFEINIGSACNCRCVFCTHAALGALRETGAPAGVVAEEIDRAAVRGFKSLGFLGGEITVRRDILDIISHARLQGFERIAICTNGRNLADRLFLDRLIEAGVNRVALSVHSHREAVEDRITARKGAFAQKLAAVRNCLAAEDEGRLPQGFALNSCIHGLNYSELNEMAAFFRGLGVKDMRFTFVRPEHLAARSKKLVPRMSDVMPDVVRLVIGSERRPGMSVTFGDIPLCQWPRRFFDRPERSRRYVGELRDLDTEVTLFWKDRKGRAGDRFNCRSQRAGLYKTFVNACSGCALRGPCEGPWKRYVELYGDGEFRAFETTSA